MGTGHRKVLRLMITIQTTSSSNIHSMQHPVSIYMTYSTSVTTVLYDSVLAANGIVFTQPRLDTVCHSKLNIKSDNSDTGHQSRHCAFEANNMPTTSSEIAITDTLTFDSPTTPHPTCQAQMEVDCTLDYQSTRITRITDSRKCYNDHNLALVKNDCPKKLST